MKYLLLIHTPDPNSQAPGCDAPTVEEFMAYHKTITDAGVVLESNALDVEHATSVQLGPDGQLDQGTLYIEKPGKMRFFYQPPSPTLIVATDGYFYVRNARLNTVDRYDLSDVAATARQAGDGCVLEAPGGWINLHVAHPGRITLRISLTASALLGTVPACS